MVLNDNFQLDERLYSSSFHLIDWPLSRVLLKNNANYPWVMLVPRRQNITEITGLLKSERYQLMDEIHELTLVVEEMFKPDKINIGTLGNIVSQFHMHVVARFQKDLLWPQGVWQLMLQEKSYVEPEYLIADLVDRLSVITFG